MVDDRLIREVFEARPQGKTNRGRLRTSESEEARGTAKNKGILWGHARELAQDRKT